MRCEKMQPRIVSLIPSATEIVHALDFGDCQLGRSHECDYPESVLSLPVCTAPKFSPSGNSREIDQDVRDTSHDALSVYDVFHPVLEQLQPSHIITQSQCEVCAVNLKDVELAVGKLASSDPQLVSLEAHSWPDVL
ncbi:MAG: cobalamin-binding protein, partial [Acidobacteriota bacterium]|nr:cobalamin-binding protein [Acidobacteriota bacterium]